MRTSRLWLIVIAIVAIILLFPRKQIVAPEWTIYTLDANMHPLANITVREVWQQYSLENQAHEEDRLTDSSGRVQFPRRYIRSNITQTYAWVPKASLDDWRSRELWSELLLGRFWQGR